MTGLMGDAVVLTYAAVVEKTETGTVVYRVSNHVISKPIICMKERMKKMKYSLIVPLLLAVPVSSYALDSQSEGLAAVPDHVVAKQRENLAENTAGKGFGPQSPRDIDSMAGNNPVSFGPAPSYRSMNLCNIHFHKNAEHKGGEFTTYAGNGDGKGYASGYQYSGVITAAERAAPADAVCPDDHGSLVPGDTIEVHYVHTSAQVEPGPTLGACLSESIKNPQLRVEAQVYVLVNDKKAPDFMKLTEYKKRDGLYQAVYIPQDTGLPVQYSGSTTGPGYNEQGSPLQVSWSVRPKVMRVNIESVGKWCQDNDFNEDHAHGVRNLVVNPDLLSEIRY